MARIDNDELFDKLTQMAISELNESSNHVSISFILSDLARSDQVANYDRYLDKVQEIATIEEFSVEDKIEITSSLVLLERYDSPILLDLLKRIRDTD